MDFPVCKFATNGNHRAHIKSVEVLVTETNSKSINTGSYGLNENSHEKNKYVLTHNIFGPCHFKECFETAFFTSDPVSLFFLSSEQREL